MRSSREYPIQASKDFGKDESAIRQTFPPPRIKTPNAIIAKHNDVRYYCSPSAE